MMHAEVIAIGDELTSGQRLDTNSQWLSQQLAEIGIQVLYHSTVGDDYDACQSVFETAFQRADLIVATGGLGPTADDLTRQTMAAAAGKDLVQDEASLRHIEDLFQRRNRTMPERNSIQAMFPEGSIVIPNPHGTAPGIDLSVTRADSSCSRIFALPGVPAEMKEMWEQSVLARIQKMAGVTTKTIQHYRLKCFGVGESACEELLPDLIRRGRTPSVGITVHRGTITLRVTAAGDSIDHCRSQMESTITTIHDNLGSLVFGEEDEELHDAVIRWLGRHQKTVAVAEWGTKGLIQNWLGSADRKREHFQGGVSVNSSESAIDLFDIHSSVAEEACGKELAQQMASQVREKFKTDFGIAITDFPTRDDGDFAFSVASSRGTVSKTRPFALHPDIQRDVAAKTALNLLRLELLVLDELSRKI